MKKGLDDTETVHASRVQRGFGPVGGIADPRGGGDPLGDDFNFQQSERCLRNNGVTGFIYEN